MALPRRLERLAVAQDRRHGLLELGPRAQVLPGPGDRPGVAQEEDEPRVGPALADAVGDEDVVRGLVDELALAAGGQLAVQHPVPEQVLEAALVQADLLHRGPRPLRGDGDAEVAEVQLLRGVDLGVAVEQHAQQRRARAQGAQDEGRRGDEPLALGRPRPAARRRRRARLAQLVARGARERAVDGRPPGHAERP